MRLEASKLRLMDGLQWGDVGTWVGGIGSAFAALTAVYSVGELRKERRDFNREREGRALRRASRIKVTVIPHFSYVPPRRHIGWQVYVENRSDENIYNVEFGTLRGIANDKKIERFTAKPDPINPDNGMPMPILDPGQELKCRYTSTDTIEAIQAKVPNLKLFANVKFSDDDGNEFCTEPLRLQGNEIVSGWRHAGTVRVADARLRSIIGYDRSLRNTLYDWH